MSDETASVVMPVSDLHAGMKCSIVVNDPLYEVEDIVTVNAEGDVQITFSVPGVVKSQAIMRFKVTDKVEVHFTKEQAIIEFYRLDRAERDAFGVAHELGMKRQDMAGVAHSLGWRG
jgi:hypothetical protein